jgi:hypothetical protein
MNGRGITFQPFSLPWKMATIMPQYVGAFRDKMSPPKAARSRSPWSNPKTDMPQGYVSRANDKALSRRTVLDPERIHCSIVSSNISALRDVGNSVVPGSCKYTGFSSRVLWQGERFADARKKIRYSVRSKNSNISWPTLTHCPVRSAKSPSQCFFSYIGVVTTTMSWGHIRLRVPVVPRCSDKKNSGTTSLQPKGAAR